MAFIFVSLADAQIFAPLLASCTGTTLPAGSTLATALLFNTDLDPITDIAPVWSSSNPAVATVDPSTGEVTAISPGDVNIIATVGLATGFAPLQVISQGLVATGGTVTNDANWRYHTFTNSADFTVLSNPGGIAVEYLIVAGGAAGAGVAGSGIQGGGGGGGGVLHGTTVPTEDVHSVVVGAGGVATQGAADVPGWQGGDSSALGFTAKGGGRGGAFLSNSRAGIAGGSGGGGGGSSSNGAGGAGTAGQGNAGGAGASAHGGGGGGASEVGHAGNAGVGPSRGGEGSSFSTSGAAVTYGSGGGGARNDATSALGGTGAGRGAGAVAGGATANQGEDATGVGCGGGGGRNGRGGHGKAGVVIIRYPQCAAGEEIPEPPAGDTTHLEIGVGDSPKLVEVTGDVVVILVGPGGKGALNNTSPGPGGGGGGGVRTIPFFNLHAETLLLEVGQAEIGAVAATASKLTVGATVYTADPGTTGTNNFGGHSGDPTLHVGGGGISGGGAGSSGEAGGGGGGASAAGESGVHDFPNPGIGGDGGAGVSVAVFDQTFGPFGGGGGGGVHVDLGPGWTPGVGGAGGGGNGANESVGSTPGTDGLGGGGGGGANARGGHGTILLIWQANRATVTEL